MTFLFNGGPGSGSVWLQMGAFGPKRVAIPSDARDDGAPAVRDDRRALLDNLLDQLALALERGRLESDARELGRTRERDRVRSALLSTIGHDLRPSLNALAKSVRGLRRDGAADKILVSEIGAETVRVVTLS